MDADNCGSTNARVPREQAVVPPTTGSSLAPPARSVTTIGTEHRISSLGQRAAISDERFIDPLGGLRSDHWVVHPSTSGELRR
jgi:hypothetical protein